MGQRPHEGDQRSRFTGKLNQVKYSNKVSSINVENQIRSQRECVIFRLTFRKKIKSAKAE